MRLGRTSGYVKYAFMQLAWLDQAVVRISTSYDFSLMYRKRRPLNWSAISSR